MKCILISTYELGRQPFGLASPLTWLREAGIEVKTFDLSIEKLALEECETAQFVAFYLPMHTATRIAVPVISRIREIHPAIHICAFGLYAPMNEKYLRRLGVNSIVGGEFEEEILRLVVETRLQREENPVVKKPTNALNGINVKGIFLDKQRFKLPTRYDLPDLEKYAFLTMPDASRRTVGYTEASRGCKHLCRHCPVVPVYKGRFMIVQHDVVIADIAQQVAAGARHITFGDPDFFNGIGHATKVITTLQQNWPDLSYDVTIKVEHLIRYATQIKTLRDTGCLFITSAVESVDDDILLTLDKGHTRADFIQAVDLCRQVDLVLNPTFVAFTPWISLKGYQELLRTILELDLVDAVSPVQLAIRLLIPEGSLLLELDDLGAQISKFDEAGLLYPWCHKDPRVDELQDRIGTIVEEASKSDLSRIDIFEAIWNETATAMGEKSPMPIESASLSARKLPFLSEDWYCCAEPTKQQMEACVL